MSLADMDGYLAGLDAIGASLRSALRACREKGEAERRVRRERRRYDAAEAERRARLLGIILGGALVFDPGGGLGTATGAKPPGGGTGS